MRKFGLALALLVAGLWSAAVWGGYALLAWTGAFVAENAGTVGLPAEAREVAAWAGLLVENFGQGTAMVLWLLGIGLIALLLLGFNAVVGRLSPAPAAPMLPRERPVPPPPPPTTPAWGRDAGRR